jgi:hypothetical protein
MNSFRPGPAHAWIRGNILALATICAVLAIAPPTALGKTIKFEGPIDLAFFPSVNGFAVDVPAIEMKVGFAGKGRKAIPGGTLKAVGLYGLCAPGSYGCNDSGKGPETGALPREAPHCNIIAGQTFGDQINFKKKRFSATWSALGPDAPQTVVEQNTFRITGRVTKRSVTGTLRAYNYSPAGVYSTGSTDTYFPAATCDSGVLTYRASR